MNTTHQTTKSGMHKTGSKINQEGRDLVAKWIRQDRRDGYKVKAFLGGQYIPNGFRYLAARFFTTSPIIKGRR